MQAMMRAWRVRRIKVGVEFHVPVIFYLHGKLSCCLNLI